MFWGTWKISRKIIIWTFYIVIICINYGCDIFIYLLLPLGCREYIYLEYRKLRVRFLFCLIYREDYKFLEELLSSSYKWGFVGWTLGYNSGIVLIVLHLGFGFFFPIWLIFLFFSNSNFEILWSLLKTLFYRKWGKRERASDPKKQNYITNVVANWKLCEAKYLLTT